MKKITIYFSWMFSCLLTSCGFSVSGSGSSASNNQMFCDWQNNKNAVFYNASFKLPCSNGDCGYRFENNNLADVLNQHSIYDIMQNIHYNYCIARSFELQWTVTLVGEIQCTSPSQNYNHVTVTLDNFQQIMSNQNAVDILSGTPYVPDTTFVNPEKHKHELVLKLYDVENTYNNDFGTLTWKISWIKPDNFSGAEWQFNFHDQEVEGTFISNRYIYIQPRHIYKDGQYQDI